MIGTGVKCRDVEIDYMTATTSGATATQMNSFFDSNPDKILINISLMLWVNNGFYYSFVAHTNKQIVNKLKS